MFRVISVILLVVSLSGCSNLMQVFNAEIEAPDVNMTWQQAQWYAVTDIDYVYDSVEYGYDYWQTPLETYIKGTGDCEDFAFFVGYFAWREGRDVQIVGYERGPNDYHAIIKVDGNYYEPQSGMGVVFNNPNVIYYEGDYQYTYNQLHGNNTRKGSSRSLGDLRFGE